MKIKSDLNGVITVISILVLIDILIQTIYFYSGWRNDIVTGIISFIGNMTNFYLVFIIPLLFIYSVVATIISITKKQPTFTLLIINSISLSIMLFSIIYDY